MQEVIVLSLKQRKQTQNPAAVALGAEMGEFDKSAHMCPGENARLLVAVSSKVENLGIAIYCGKGKEERSA